MNQYQIADIFDQIANLLQIKGEVIYKILAYRKAADSLRETTEDLHRLRAENRLTDIPGVGKAIADKISELLTTGQLEFYERLQQEVPPSLAELLDVPDVGPRKALLFYQQAGVTSLAELELAAREGRLRSVPGIGEKTEARILAGIESYARRSNRMTLGTALPLGERWLRWLQAQPGVVRAELAGSLRRMKVTIGDLDLVAATNQPDDLMQAFRTHPEVGEVLAQGDEKTSVELRGGVRVQLWTQSPERFGALLQFVTGSKEHNVRLRELSLKKGWSLSQHGLINPQGEEQVFETEDALYQALGLQYIPPEMREDRGEVQAAAAGRLPQLVSIEDITADLHTHSTWSDGTLSILDMGRAAAGRGMRVLAICDHSGGLGIAGGLDIGRLRAQRSEIQQAQAELGDQIRLLHGSEVEIRADGSLDFPDEVLAELDIVVASLHSQLRKPREEVTARLIRAIENPHVDVIGHPSGRLLPNREGADLDWDAVYAAVVRSGVALEINAHPNRLDLDDAHARRAAELGIPISINTDSHSAENMDLLRFGVGVARRAWLTAERVINAWPTDRLLAWLAGRG